MRVTNTIDEQRFDVGPQLAENYILFDDLVPGVEREERLHGSGWAWIKRNDSTVDARMEEERHVDRDQQVVPLRVGHPEIGKKLRTAGDAPILTSGHCIEEGCAGFAGTDDLSRSELNPMRMLVPQVQAAQLAPFDGATGASELAKRGE